MANLKNIYSNSWPFALIIALWLVVVLVNYEPGTWLIGWDSLLPELDLKLNIQRSILGTWQEFQGLGVKGGMAHGADLSREIVLTFLSYLLPISLLRYVWTFLMLLIGPLGVYVICQDFIDTDKEDGRLNQKIYSLVAACFYLLNLATVQYFFVPFEAFSSFYGFFPWILYFFIKYLKDLKIKHALFFSLVLVVSSSAFYVQTLFIVLVVVLFIYTCHYLLAHKQKLYVGIKQVVLPWILLLTLSFYWLAPVAFSSLNSAQDLVNSQQSRLSTPETILMNRGFGTLKDIALLKGFWFQYTDYDVEDKEINYLFDVWLNHTSSLKFKLIGYFLFSFGCFGFISFWLKKKKNIFLKSTTTLSIVTILMLTGGRGWLGLPYRWLSNVLPLFEQIFRSPFTKWSIILSFCIAIGLAYFSKLVLSKIQNDLPNLKFMVFFVYLFSLLSLVSPIFEGHLIYSSVRVPIPEEYFALFNYLRNVNSQARILYLPHSGIWGWQFNDWGYRGSGFLWYGIKQPILHRNFDIWGSTNEQAHRELDYALRNQDLSKIKQLVTKYEISYVLVDGSVINTLNHESGNVSEITNLFKDSGGEIAWKQGFLTLISTHLGKQTKSFFTAPDRYFFVNYQLFSQEWDPIIEHYPSYVLSEDRQSSIYFPFSRVDDFKLLKQDNALIINQDLSNNYKVMLVPSLAKGDYYAGFVEVHYTGQQIFLEFLPSVVSFGQREVSLSVPKKISFKVSDNIQNIVLDINGKLIRLRSGERKQVWLDNLVIGEPLLIVYFDQDLAFEENGVMQVYKKNTKKYQESSILWDPLILNSMQEIDSKNTNNIRVDVQSQQIDLFGSKTNVENCDVFKRGNTEKIIENKFYVYSVNDFGSLCEGFYLQDTSSYHDYLIEIQGVTIKNRALKLFINEVSSKSLILEETTTNGPYNKHYFLASNPGYGSSKLSLNLQIDSLGGEEALTRVEELNLYKIPSSLQRISQIHLITSQDYSLSNDLKILNEKKIGSGIYFINVRNNGDNVGLLTLDQSFDKSWKLINLSQRDKIISSQLYKNWANAWQINPGEYQLVLIYLPQLATLTGLILLFVVFIYLGIWYHHSK